MKLEVGIPKGSKQQLFLDHLNAAFRSVVQNSQGSAHFRTDGTFESTISGSFKFAANDVLLTMTIIKKADGTLDSIEVVPNDSSVEDVSWKEQTHALLEMALTSTISERTNKYFQRKIYYYIGPQLDGEYWLSGLRFAPANPEDTDPAMLNAERVVELDMDIKAIDQLHSLSVANATAARHAARLSLLLNVGLYETPSELRWVQVHSAESSTTHSERLALGFIPKGNTIDRMPEKGALSKAGHYASSLTEMFHRAGIGLSLPKETRRILRGIESAPPHIGDAFDRCCRLYRIALLMAPMFPSVALAYRVAAVEAIVQANPNFTSFSDFILKNVSDRPNLKETVDYLYGPARSAHFHAGEFVLGEYSINPYFNVLMDSETVERFDIRMAGYFITREAIIRWIVSSLPELSEASQIMDIDE